MTTDHDNVYEPVGGAVSALIVRVLDGWTPSTPTLGDVTRLEWGGTDVTVSAKRVNIRGDVLEIDWQDDTLPLLFREDEYEQFRNMPFNGDVGTEWRFSAQDGLFGGALTLEGHYWHVELPGRAARLWIARIEGLAKNRDLDAPGNLRVRQTHDGMTYVAWGHRFQGAYTYYLVRAKDGGKSWFLIIDTGNEQRPARDRVFQDVLALQFVLGCGLFFEVIYGLDETDVVALVGGRHGRDHGGRPKVEPPVPFAGSQEHWVGAFFNAISTTYRARPELRLYIGLSFYLDSLMSFHVEGRYLALHVALEAFAYWYLKAEKDPEDPERPLVDKQKWRAWLAENKPAILTLASEDSGEVLFNKIASVPARRASSRVVEDAFRKTGIEILPGMATELEEGRGRIVHTAAMFEDRQERLDAYLEPIALVRTMLVALLARVVGYRGAIVGWTREPHRPRQQPDAAWWPVDQACHDAALRRYDVQTEFAAGVGEPTTAESPNEEPT